METTLNIDIGPKKNTDISKVGETFERNGRST